MFKVNQLVYLKKENNDRYGGDEYNSMGIHKRYGKNTELYQPFLFLGYMAGDEAKCIIATPKGKVLWDEDPNDFQDTVSKYSWEEEKFGYG